MPRAHRRLLRLVEHFLQPGHPPRRSRARAQARNPTSTARTTIRLAERRRARREQAKQERQRSRSREGRGLQWWTAIGTVLAGLVAVPAFVISTKALNISEQQRADGLAQRAEDQRKSGEERVASYARNVTYHQAGNLKGWVRAKDGLRIGERWILNRNPGEASVWSVEENADGELRVAMVRVPPCMGIKVEPQIADYAVFNPLDVSFWSVASIGQLNNRLTPGVPVFDAIERARAERHRGRYELEILAQRRIEPCG